MPKLPRGMKRLSSADLTGAVQPPSDPGLRVPNVGGAEAEALSDIGKQVQVQAQNRLDAQFAAQARRQNRQDIIHGVKAQRQFNAEGRDEFTKTQDTEDIALEETQDKYRTFVNQSKSKILAAYKGSGVGREKLEAKLEAMTSTMLDDASIAGDKEQRRQLGEQITEDIDAQVAEAQADPTRIAESLQNINQILLDSENGLTLEQEDAFATNGRTQVYEQGMNTLIFKGDINEAISLLNTPDARRALGVEKVQAMRVRFKKFEESKKEDPGLADKVDELRALGVDVSDDDIRGLAGIKSDPAKHNKLEQAIAMFKTADDNDIFISQEQKNQVFRGVLGVEKTPEELGIAEAEQQIAKNVTLKASGELTGEGGDLIDDTGNIKNEVSNTISTLLTEAAGGVRDVNGKVTGITPEQAKFLVPLKAEVESLILEGKVQGINDAVAIVLANKDFPQAKTFADTADDLLKRIEKSNEESEARAGTEFDKIDVNNASGPGSAIINFTNKTFGAVFDSFLDMNNVKDRNKVKALSLEYTRLIRAGERPSVFNQQRMEQIFGGPSITKSGEFVRAEMRSLRDQLTDAIRIDKIMLADPRMPEKSARDLLGSVINTSRFIKKLEAFDLTPGGSETVKMDTPADVEAASPKDIAKFMDRQSKESFRALPQDVKAALKAADEKGSKPTQETGPAQAEPQASLSPESKKIVLDSSDEELDAMIKEARETDSEFLPFLEEEFETRAGQGSEDGEKKSPNSAP